MFTELMAKFAAQQIAVTFAQANEANTALQFLSSQSVQTQPAYAQTELHVSARPQSAAGR